MVSAELQGASEHSGVAERVSFRWVCALLLTSSFALTTARLMQAQPLASANDRSRWCTVWSLVERDTYQIDEIRQRPGWDTIDLVRHEGHFYSTKPPLLSTLVAGLYWGVKRTLGWTLDDDLAGTSRLILMIINILPFYAALLLFVRLLERHAQTSYARLFLMMTAAWGILALPFLVTLNNHTPAFVGVIVCVWALNHVLTDGQNRGWLYAVVGLSAAATCCVELPAAALGVMVFILLFRRSPRQTLLWFLPAALLPLVAFFITNVAATGSWKPFYMFYGTDKYRFVHEGVPSYWIDPQGLDQGKDSFLTYLMHCTFGHHGVFSLTPVFVLALWSWITCYRWKQPSLRALLWLGLAVTLVVFGFYLSKKDNYNFGGVSVALRWTLWLIPFWLLSMIPVLDRCRATAWRGAILLGLLGFSVYSAWSPFTGPWNQPWLYQRLEQAGWIDYSSPAAVQGEPFYAWIHELPPATSSVPLADYWSEWTGVDITGDSVRLRLEDGGRVERDGQQVQRINVIEEAGTARREWSLDIDREALAAGRPVSELVVWPDPPPAAAERRRVMVFLHGLPRLRAYVPGRLRYLKTPLRTDAFPCRLAASRVVHRPSEQAPLAVYRRDLWLSDAVPFGVVRFETTVTDPQSGAVESRQVMSLTAVGTLIGEAASDAAPQELPVSVLPDGVNAVTLQPAAVAVSPP